MITSQLLISSPEFHSESICESFTSFTLDGRLPRVRHFYTVAASCRYNAGTLVSYAHLMGYRLVSHDTDGMQEKIWWTQCASQVRDTQMSIFK